MPKKTKKTAKKTFKKIPTKPSLLVLLFVTLSLAFLSLFEPVQTEKLPRLESPVELYSNKNEDDLQAYVVDAISRAKESVTLIVYGLSDHEVIAALRNQAAKGIKVQVVCDAKANPDIQTTLGKQVATVKRDGKGLMHQKILLIDGQEVWIGSANMTSESLKLHGNLVAAMRSPELCEFIQAKANSMGNKKKGMNFSESRYQLGEQFVEFIFLPDNKSAADKILQMIQTANKTIKVAMFTWTRKDFAKAIIQAQRRGVKVEVILDRYAGKGAGSEITSLLQRYGVPVALSTSKGLLHYKTMIIDDKILVNGSANWTKAAFTQNDDCIMIIHGLTEGQANCLQNMWQTLQRESAPFEEEDFLEPAA